MPKELYYEPGTIGDRINNLIDAKMTAENTSRITGEMIAKYADITPSCFSKIKNGKIQKPRKETLEKIANYLNTTAYELQYGVSAENSHIYTKVPLSDKALTWLNTNRECAPELVQVLDLILSNKSLADNFFGHLLLYVKGMDFHAELKSSDDIILEEETSAEISKLLLMNSIYKLMEQLKQNWREKK